MTLPKGMKLVIGQRKYKGPCEIKDNLLPKGLKEKIEKKAVFSEKAAAENDKQTKVIKK